MYPRQSNAEIACEATVAQAAPAIPIPNVRMKRKSSPIFSTVANARNQSGVQLSPSARMKHESRL